MMRNIIFPILFLSLFVVPGLSFAQDYSPLVYDGKLVNPLCFDLMALENRGLDTRHPVMDLKTCHLQHAEDLRQRGALLKMESGAVGYDFEQGHFHYGYLGKAGSADYVVTSTSGGGSANFDYILKLKIDGSRMEVIDTIGMGDRCNGGLSDVRIENSHLLYSRAMTPASFGYVALERKIISQRASGNVLISSPIDCVAVGEYQDEELAGIRLLNEQDLGTQYDGPRYGCFFTAQAEYRSQNGAHIPKERIDDFLKSLAIACSLQ